MPELITAMRELNEHPTTVFTVLTGEGRFFSAGADVRSKGSLLLVMIDLDG
jgi:peroxisomal 3,2-trans-enoyl-CoA isomerase